MEKKNIEYDIMFADYPDVVNLVQMREMLGKIGSTLAYKIVRTKQIKSRKVGREYRIPKINIIEYLLSD